MALKANQFFKLGVAGLIVLAALPLVLSPISSKHCPTPTQLVIKSGTMPNGGSGYCIAEVPVEAVSGPRATRLSSLCEADKAQAERFGQHLTIARQIEQERCLRAMPGLYAWAWASLTQRM